jgi:hypothetical protein
MPELRDLVSPPPRRRFDEELWDRLEAAQGAAARRWRVVAVATAVLAAAGIAAAGVLAVNSTSSAVVDRTLSCPAPNGKLQLFAHVPGRPIFVYGTRQPRPALLELDAGRSVALNGGVLRVFERTYAGAYTSESITQKAGYTIDGGACRATGAIPLSSSGLPSAGVFSGTQGAGIATECLVGGTATLRMHVTLAKSGLPVAAELALRSGASRRPVAFIQWTSKHVHAWLARGCHAYMQTAP